MSATHATIKIALRNVTRQRTRSAILLGALALFVALSVALDAFASGFYRAMTEVAVGQTLGEVQLHAEGHLPSRTLSATLPGRVAEDVTASAGVRVVAPRVRVSAMAAADSGARPLDLLGVDPERELSFGPLQQRLKAGRFLAAQDGGAIVLPAKLAAALKLAPGDEVAVTAGAASGLPVTRSYVVAGTLGGDESRVAYVPRSALQAQLGLGADVLTEIAIRTTPQTSPQEAAKALAAVAPQAHVQTWAERAPALAAAMTTDHNFLRATYGLFVLIAGLMVLNLQLMAVLERTRELGMLLALGTTPRRLMAILTLEATALGGLGVVLGLGLGLLAVAAMSGGVDIASYVADAGTVAGVAMVPVVYPFVDGETVGAVCLGIGVATVLAAVGPALRLRRMNPVTAMHADGAGA